MISITFAPWTNGVFRLSKRATSSEPMDTPISRRAPSRAASTYFGTALTRFVPLPIKSSRAHGCGSRKPDGPYQGHQLELPRHRWRTRKRTGRPWRVKPSARPIRFGTRCRIIRAALVSGLLTRKTVLFMICLARLMVSISGARVGHRMSSLIWVVFYV